MATVFSTATLGLRVDSKQFNKEFTQSQRITERALDSMSRSAAAFDERWSDLTAGIKDTKRIISGILVSQGFYALSNALVSAGAAALTFSMNMETAAVSLEYFVDAAEGTEAAAAEVQAYLREVNEFAARTPFNTDDVLTLSKYMQAVGVAMGQTQSVLSVITDTAAATGASEEQLQRITFALGQMLTKGRIANEEIRQLANANIPIYQILQEELNLTGEQISNIGNYWIDADKAVVAILNGLNKRYAGAADRIAETLTGLTDTIIDDAKIIADIALGGIYDKIVQVAGTLRDTLDEWRTIATEQGSYGLANHLLIEVDPTGQIGNQILNTIGHIINLKDAFIELYHAAAPVLGVIGQSLAASLEVGLIALTAFAELGTQVIGVLEGLGLTSGEAARAIASLYVAYKAAKLVSLLGQSLASAGMSAYTAAQGLLAILPASWQANAGIVALTASVATLISYLLTAAGIFGMLNSGFSGLQDTSGGSTIATGWQDAYAEYQQQMEEYNAAIDQYRKKYEEDYTAMDTGGGQTAKKEDDDGKNGNGGGGGGQTDWVAAFDEVYDVPNEDDGTGAYQDEVLDDLSALLSLLDDIVFPNLDSLELNPPEFDWGKVFGEDFWEPNDADADFWKSFLPITLVSAVGALGKVFAKQYQDNKNKFRPTDDINTKSTSALDDAFVDVDKAAADAAAKADELAKRVDEFKATYERLQKAYLKASTINDGESHKLLGSLLNKAETQFEALQAAELSLNKLLVQAEQTPVKLDELARLGRELNNIRVPVLSKQLRALQKELSSQSLTQLEALAVQEEIKSLTKRLRAAQGGAETLDLSGRTLADLEQLLNLQYPRLLETFSDAFTGAMPLTAGGVHVYDLAAAHTAQEELLVFREILDAVNARGGALEGMDSYGARFAKLITPELQNISKQLEIYLATAQTANSYRVLGATGLTRNSELPEVEKLLQQANETQRLLTDYARAFKKMDPSALAASAAQQIISSADSTARKLTTAISETGNLIDQRIAGHQANAAILSRWAAKQRADTNASVLRAIADIEFDTEATLDPALLRSDLRAIRRELKRDSTELVEVREAIETLTNEGKLQTAFGRKTLERLEQLELNTKALLQQEADLVKQLEELTGKTSTSLAKPIYTDDVIRKTISSFERLNDALEAAYKQPSALVKQTEEVIAKLADSLDPSLQRVLAAHDMTVTDLLMTGTKVQVLGNGLDAFDGSIGRLTAEVIQQTTDVSAALRQMTSGFVEATAALGTALEPIIRHAASLRYVTDMKIGGTGHIASATAPYIIQNDATVQLLKEVVNGKPTFGNLITADIKTMSDKVVSQLKANGIVAENGIIQIDAAVLKLVGKESYYGQFAAGIKALNENLDQMLMLTFNRDFDFGATQPNLVGRWQQQMRLAANNSNIPFDALSGRMFSVDALEAYGAARHLTGVDADTLAGMYLEEVIRPLFTNISGELDLRGFANTIGEALDRFLVKYTPTDFASIGLEELAKATFENNKLAIALAEAGVSTEDFLKGAVRVMRDGAETFTLIDFTPVIRNYKKMSRSVPKFFEAVLGTSDGFKTGAFTKAPIIDQIDQLVAQFNAAVLNSGDVDAALKTFKESMRKISDAASKLASGTDVSDEIRVLFGRAGQDVVKYKSSLQLLAEATETLATTPQLTAELPRMIRATVDQANRITLQMQHGLEVSQGDVAQLLRGYRSTVEMLGLSTDTYTLRLGEQLTALSDYLKSAGGKAKLVGEQIFRIQLPYSVADITDQLRLTAAHIKQGIADGTIVLAGETAEYVRNTLASIPTDDLRLVTIADLAQGMRANLLDTIIFDIETANDVLASALGTQTSIGRAQPLLAQLSGKNVATGAVFDTWVNQGDKNADVLDFLKQLFGSTYDTVDIDALAKAPGAREALEMFADFVGPNAVLRGWNATNVGGFDLSVINALYQKMGMDQQFIIGEDVMSLVTRRAKEILDWGKDLKLVDAVEIFVGELEDAAHIAENDVEYTARVFQALEDGTVDEILRRSAFLGKPSLANMKEAGAAYRYEQAIKAGTVPTGGAEEVIDESSTFIKSLEGLNDAERKIALQLRASKIPELTKQYTQLDQKIVSAQEALSDVLDDTTRLELTKTLDKLKASRRELGAELLTLGDQVDDDLRLLVRNVVGDSTAEAFKETAEHIGSEAATFSGEVIDEFDTMFADTVDEIFGERSAFWRAINGIDAAEYIPGNKVTRAVQRFTDKIGELWESAVNKLSYVNINAARKLEKFTTKPLLQAQDDLADALRRFEGISAQVDELVRTHKQLPEELRKAFMDARAGYKQAYNDFVDSLIVDTHTALKKLDSVDVDDFLKRFNTNAEYMAYYFDQASGQMKTIGGKLYNNGDELLEGLKQLALNGEFGAEAAEAVKRAASNLDDAIVAGRGVSSAAADLADEIQTAFRAFAPRGVVYSVSDDVLTAGEYAAKNIDAAFGTLETTFSGAAKKVLTGTIAGFSALDAVGIGIDLLVQHLSDTANQDYAGAYISSMLSETTLEMFEQAGIDSSEVLTTGFVNAMGSAAAQSLLETVATNAIMVIAGIIGGIPALIGGLVLSIASAIGLDAVLGNDFASEYSGSWRKALSGEGGTDTAYFESIAKSAGYSQEQIAQLLPAMRLIDSETMLKEFEEEGYSAVHQRTGNGQSLLLTTGHFVGMAVGLILQTNQFQNIRNTFFDIPFSGADHTHGEGNIFINGHLFDQAVVLKHNANGAAQIGDLTLADPLQRITVDVNGTGGGLQLAGDQLDDGRLAGTGGADQKTKFTILNLHSNSVQSGIALGVSFYDVGKFYHIHLSPVIRRLRENPIPPAV